MEFGIRLPASGASLSLENLMTVAIWAEELGYHSIWLGDHVVLPEVVNSSYPYGPNNRWSSPADTKLLDPFLTLAWVASSAPSVKLGTSVLVAPLRNPVLLAKQLSSLDYLSNGRVIFGVGVGWMKEEFDLIGVPFVNRGKRTVEMIQLMRALWTGETVEFKGEFYQISACKMHPKPIQATIPIIWGGHSDIALKRVAQVGDGWNPTQISLEQLAIGLKKLYRYCDIYNRNPASIQVIARPGKTYPINTETHAKHQELGVHQLILDPPLDAPDLSTCRAEMERIAEIGGLHRRH